MTGSEEWLPIAARRPHTGGMSTRPRTATRVLPTSPFQRKEVVPPTTDGFEVGDRVTLDSWGMGRVTEVTPDAVTVVFGSPGGVRRIPAGTRGFSRL